MLPIQIRQALAVDLELVRSRSDYFAGYAQQSGTDTRPSMLNLIELSQRLPPDESADPVVALEDPVGRDPVADELLAELEQLNGRETVPQWMRVAEVADAWRESALAQLLLDVEDARQKLKLASDQYVRLGLPVGWYLAQVAVSDVDAAWSAGRWLGALSAGPSAAEPGEDREGLLGVRSSLPTGAQQVYLLLTAAAVPQVVEEYRGMFTQLREALQARSSTPVGSTGHPIADWWAAGLALSRLHDHGARTRERLVGVIGGFGAAHGRLLARAQRDAYHWRHVCAPVDLVDLDLAGLVCLVDRALRNRNATPLCVNLR